MKTPPKLEAPLEYILERITRDREPSIRDLARELDVSASALHRMVLPALREGLLQLTASRRKIALNPDFGGVVGIDLGASHLHFALGNFRGEILNDSTEKIRPEDGPKKLIEQIKAGIRRQVAAVSRQRSTLKTGRSAVKGGRALAQLDRTEREETTLPFIVRGIAIGVPSPVHPVTGVVSLANNLPGWKNIPLARTLEKEFRVPVVVENDGNMAALGEHWRGVASGVDSFVFIALGTGIGAGVFVNGELVRGRTGSAGELFRLNLEWQRWDEDFGDIGYYETHVSGMGIAAEGRKRMGRPASGQQGSLAAERDAYFVFESLRQGNPQARAVVEKVFTMLGVGIANLVALLDPDLIVLGGGVVKGAPELLLSTLDRVVHRIQKEITPPIKLSALEDKAQTYGAIVSALTAAQQAALRRQG